MLVQLILARAEVTVPVPVPAPLTVNVNCCRNVAATVRARSIVTVQGSVPGQPIPEPLHPLKAQPAAGVAVSDTWVPLRKSAVHVPPLPVVQLIPTGDELTVPLPVIDTPSVKSCWKVAVTDRAAVMLSTQLPVPEQFPLQPTNAHPPAGAAVSVTDAPLAKSAAQVPAFAVVQSIPAGTEVTVPVPAMDTVSWEVLGPVPSFLQATKKDTRRTATVAHRQTLWLTPARLRFRMRQSPRSLTNTDAGPPFGSSAILGSFVACEAGVAEESEDPWLCVPGFGRVCLCRLVRHRRVGRCQTGVSRSRDLVATIFGTRDPQAKQKTDQAGVLLSRSRDLLPSRHRRAARHRASGFIASE